MDKSSNKYKEDNEYPEEVKTLIKILMRLHFQNNTIYFTLTLVLSFIEKSTEQINMMWKSRHLKSGTFWINSIVVSVEYIPSFALLEYQK